MMLTLQRIIATMPHMVAICAPPEHRITALTIRDASIMPAGPARLRRLTIAMSVSL